MLLLCFHVLVDCNRAKTSSIDRRLDTGADQDSLKCTHPSLEQNKLETAHDSPQLPVSVREDGEAWVFFSVLHYTLSPDG